jgi:uncharacterized protein
MTSIIKKLHSENHLKGAPPHVLGGTEYEVLMGSQAYGVSSDDSDWDIYGFCIPPKTMVFPHLEGRIAGFGAKPPSFDVYQQHHVKSGGRNYDLSVYSIVRYFSLCMENNPNMIDSLFVPVRCRLHTTPLSNLVIDHRRAFLHKGCWHKFKGYAYSQMHKMKIKAPEGGRRAEDITTHGYDTKFAYHVVRLLDECEQILTTGDLSLEQNREQLKSIRRGEWSQERITAHFEQKEKDLESVYSASTLPWGPDEEALRKLLLECLEMAYGKLDAVVPTQSHADTLQSIIALAQRALGAS